MDTPRGWSRLAGTQPNVRRTRSLICRDWQEGEGEIEIEKERTSGVWRRREKKPGNETELAMGEVRGC